LLIHLADGTLVLVMEAKRQWSDEAGSSNGGSNKEESACFSVVTLAKENSCENKSTNSLPSAVTMYTI